MTQLAAVILLSEKSEGLTLFLCVCVCVYNIYKHIAYDIYIAKSIKPNAADISSKK
jgi:hypothetical protein